MQQRSDNVAVGILSSGKLMRAIYIAAAAAAGGVDVVVLANLLLRRKRTGKDKKEVA